MTSYGQAVFPSAIQVEAFISFITKRELLRLKKESGAAWPWSDDEILNAYKFTNVKREDDRTTRWMRAHWTGPNLEAPAGKIIFNCGLFRYFGTIEFAKHVGWQCDWNPLKVIEAARIHKSSSGRLFTGAYIIPTLGLTQPKHVVVCNEILTPLWQAKDELARVAEETSSWRLVGERLMQLPGFGGTGFMAKELLQDAMHTPVFIDVLDRNSWCPIGPGARRGLNRMLGRSTSESLSASAALEGTVRVFEAVQGRIPDWMPLLELHDIQFQLCEFDKYERARLGEGRPKSRYFPPTVSRDL